MGDYSPCCLEFLVAVAKEEKQEKKRMIFCSRLRQADFRIVVARNAGDARSFVDRGFCPIECAFGEESVVDELELDHHGHYSHQRPVSIRSAEDLYGACVQDPRFVVTGPPDADASFAIACLSGILPFEEPRGRRALLELGKAVAARDMDPLSADLADSEAYRKLRVFNVLKSGQSDQLAWYATAQVWRWLLSSAAAEILEQAAADFLVKRRNVAREAKIEKITSEIALITAPVWGFDVWYREVAPVIVHYNDTSKIATVGCRDNRWSSRLLGPSGLRSVYAELEPPGWGGRETVGGSPRATSITLADARNAAIRIAKAVDEQRR